MAIERLVTVRYWERHTQTDWRSKRKRILHRRFTYATVFIFLAGLISQHPNILIQRYKSIHINYKRLMMIMKPNEKCFYGYHQFNSSLFDIISFLILDTTMPIVFILILNIFLLREIKKLPLSLQIKVKESIGILFFLTFLSSAIIPRAFIVFYKYHSFDNEHFLFKNLLISFYICLGKFWFLFFSFLNYSFYFF